MIGAAPPPPAAVAPVQRYFKDWLLVCDNARRCVARSTPADDDAEAAMVMNVIREAGPASAPRITLEADMNLELDQMVVDDAALSTRFRRNHDKALELSGPAAVAYLRRIRNGRLLRPQHTDDGPWTRLDGLSAALLAMDDAQGRIGTVTAIVRPGPKPASAVPPPPPLPVLTPAPPPPPLKGGAALAAAVRRAKAADLKAHDCETRGATPGDEAQPLNAEEAVVLLGCGMGAYQGWSLAYRVPLGAPASAALLRLPPGPSLEPRRDTPDEVGAYTEPGYDPATATFAMSAKGRGLADCGVSTTWVFDGRAFHLAQHAELTRCSSPDLPGDWPLVYRTRVVPAR